MQASKISFSQETKAALNSRPLSKAAKAKLRRERVKDYIRSQPVGTIIKQTDLAMVAGYDKSQGHGWAFINRMVAKKHITKDTSEGAHKPSWTVVGDSQTVRPGIHGVSVVEVPPKSVAKKALESLPDPEKQQALANFVKELEVFKMSGLEFTLTISNKKEA